MSNAGIRHSGQGIDHSPPTKKQRMLSKACEHCKTKKLKCDSARPCENCGRKGVECVYKEKAQPGLRPGYGKDVERRLTALEEGYYRLDQVLKQNFHLDQMDAVEAETGVLNAELQLPIGGRQSYEAQRPPALSMSQNHPSMDLPHLSTPGVETASMSTGAADIMNGATTKGLPPPEILIELAELFFDNIHPWTPLFHKPTFMANMFVSSHEILLHGMLVVTFPIWRKMVPSIQARNSYMKESRDRIMLHCIDTCSITSTQALALLAIDAVGQGPGTRMWNIMSMLNASVQQLALTREPLSRTVDPATPMVSNHDPDSTADASIVAAEERRRLFWVIFSVDHFGSVALGQASGIPLNSIKLRHPTNDMDWSQGSISPWFQPTDPIKLGPNSQPWNSYIELLSLLDRSNRLLIRPFDPSSRAHREEWQCNFRMLDVTLNTWLENAPPPCRDPFQAFDPMWTMTRATFELIKLRLYTVAAFPSGSSTELPPSSSARTRCRDSVRMVTLLSSCLKLEELDKLSPTFAFIVWVAARSLVILWTSGYESTRGTLPDDLESLMSVLRLLSARWPCASHSLEILKLIIDTHNEVGGANHLQIFNDTRRTAYGLQALLGPPALRQEAHELEMFDFLNMTFPHVNDINSFTEPVGHGVTQDWLG